MDSVDASISNIDASSKVLLKSVVQKLLPSLVAPAESLDWNEIVVSIILSIDCMLSHYCRILCRITTRLSPNSLITYGLI